MKHISKIFFLLLMAHNAFAGQAMIINSEGTPLVWDNSAASPISIHPEAGSCGIYSNAQMLTKLDNNLQAWTDLEYVDLAFSVVNPASGGISVDVNGTNFTDYLAYVSGVSSSDSVANINDGLNPVLFDDDGEIVESIYGDGSSLTILGFANPVGFLAEVSNPSLYLGILEGQAVFNCYCLDDGSDTGTPEHADCVEDGTPFVFTEDDLDFTMIHEMGHVLNLDHTQVNATLATDGDSTTDNDIPAMYPESVNAGDQLSPIEDDHAALASLYPQSSFFTAGNSSSSHCLVTGTLLDRYGEEMRCADLQAITSNNSFNVSFTSGAYAPTEDYTGDGTTDDFDEAQGNECLSNCGDFRFYLRPSRSYALRVLPINSNYVDGSGISPCTGGQLAQCTSTILAACDDDPGSSECVPCVAVQTLSTNSAGETLTQKIATGCLAGATVNLGNIATNSVSQIYVEATSNSSSSSGGCSLQK